MVEALVIFQCVALSGALAVLCTNALLAPRLAPKRPGESPLPSVAILVPARNEAHQITETIDALLSQEYPSFHVFALNDESSDDTGRVLAAVRRPRFTALEGAPLPRGWLGKSHACSQLAEAANGFDLLLFVDADVTLSPSALGAAVGILVDQRLSALSVFPTQICGSLAERLSVPLMDLLLYAAFPAPLLNVMRSPSFVAATGQFFLIERSSYERAGGHGAVKTEILEDMALARRVKSSGARMAVASGADTVRCRMYRSMAEVMEGFGKNLYAASGRRLVPFITALVVAATLFVAPYVGVFVDVRFFLPSALALLVRGLHAVAFRHRLLDAVVLGPFSVVFALFIALFSLWRDLTGSVTWKGRTIGQLRNPS